MITYRACLASWLPGAGCCLAAANERPAIDTGVLPPWSGALLRSAWKRDDGAPSSAYEMAQDGNGMLWLAAGDGLYTFDGARFVRHQQVYGPPLQSPVIISVAAYGETIWVAYQFGGISRFDRGAVRHYLPGVDAPTGSAQRLVRMPDGTMWATSSGGLHRLDRDCWRPVQAQEGLPPGFVPGQAGAPVRSSKRL
ncbi:hypothetical protein [Massilia sp. HP4]|uniref:hypothetical protein n=1 Tax=Massilia sp. HP4 TaxID=2562316 RepID=UPI0010C0D4D6|nr:hypothetical protein [Massilia sp. HP4]